MTGNFKAIFFQWTQHFFKSDIKSIWYYYSDGRSNIDILDKIKATSNYLSDLCDVFTLQNKIIGKT